MMPSILATWPQLARALLGCALSVLLTSAGVAAQESGTPTAALTEEVWVDVTVPAEALPPSGPVFLGLFRIVWEEGAGYRYQEDVPGVAVDCVVSGALTFRPAQDIAVIRAEARQASERVAAETETLLDPGDCVVIGTDVHRDEHNAGNGPVDFVGVVIIPDNTPPPAGAPEAIAFGPLGYIYGGHWSGTADAPAGPIELGLRRVTLGPGASLPQQTRAGDALIAVGEGALGLTATGGTPLVERAVSFTSPMGSPIAEGSETVLEAGDSAHIQDGTAFTLRNPGEAPATWWLVTVAPVAAETATPAA
jgi:mannose-6-phosphate isomerase-like protein (cupin superfamily)